MRTAEIRKGANLCKSEFVNEAHVGKHARGAVRFIRRTEHPIGYAGRGIATGDTVAVTKPGPSNGITDRDICCGRRERETIYPYRNIENLASA